MDLGLGDSPVKVSIQKYTLVFLYGSLLRTLAEQLDFDNTVG